MPGITGSCHADNAQFKFDPAGTRLIVYCDDVKIFDLNSGRVSQAPGKFDHFALAPDGELFAVATGPRVKIMNAKTAAVIASWQQEDPVFGLGISFDGKTAFTSTFAGIQFHLTSNGRKSAPNLTTSQYRTEGFVAGNMLNIMVVESDDGYEVWNIEGPAPIQQIQGTADAFLPNGFLVNTNGSKITLWDYAIEGHSGKVYPIDRGDLGLPGSHRFVTSSTDGKKVVTLASQGGDLYVWSSEPAMMEHIVRDDGEQLGGPAVVSANGKIIATVSHADGPGLTTWDAAATLTAIKHIALNKAPDKLSISGDGHRLAYLDDDSNYDVLDAVTLTSIKPAGFPAKTHAVALSVDGRTLALGQDKAISLWNLENGAKLRECEVAGTASDIVWTDSGRIAYPLDGVAVMMLAPDTCKSQQILTFGSGAALELRAKGDLILAWERPPLSRPEVQVWSETDSKAIFDATSAQGPLLDESFGQIDLLPGRRIIINRESAVHIYDLAGRSEIFSFTVDTSKFSDATAMEALPGGERLIVLQSERGAKRLSAWRLLPTLSAASTLAKAVLPECLSLNARKKLGLDLAPPRWCIEMKKRPYDTELWQQWLSDMDARKSPPLPQVD